MERKHSEPTEANPGASSLRPIAIGSLVAIIGRGVLQIIAASSGLLLVYGVVYAMEGMTDRLPTTSLRELMGATVLMVPWTLLFCSGIHDLSLITRRRWLFWIGSILLLAAVYCLNRYTSLRGFNQVAMPLLAGIFAVQPHLFRRIALLYTIVSVVFGICGALVLVYAVWIYCRGGYFTNRLIAWSVFSFAISSFVACLLSIRGRDRGSV